MIPKGRGKDEGREIRNALKTQEQGSCGPNDPYDRVVLVQEDRAAADF